MAPEPREINEGAAATKSWRRGGKGRLQRECPPTSFSLSVTSSISRISQ